MTQPAPVVIDSAVRLRETRQRVGWSQKDLARRSDVHVQTVKYWERELAGTKRNGHACLKFVKAFRAAGIECAVPVYRRRFDTVAGGGYGVNGSLAKPRCGATTRKGAPCQAKAAPGKSRCVLHGGMSTGPKTDDGRDAIAAAQRARWERYRQAV